MILNDRIRLDGRNLDVVRPLAMETDIFLLHMVQLYLQEVKHNHLTTVTLGTPLDELLVESAASIRIQRFYFAL
jgi:polyribonucleotide nucleotidyltransferase